MKKFLAGLTALSLYAAVCGVTVTADDKPKATPEETFKKKDKDSDGKLSWDEFKGKQTDEEKLKTAKATFDKKDANKDMFLSLEEFKAPAKKDK
jgi:Ca2+-binding EF-hand superfamily protein